MVNLCFDGMKKGKIMILFFPQYQAGYTPSNIPKGTPNMRALWQNYKDFFEVPLVETDINHSNTQNHIKFKSILDEQRLRAAKIIEKASPDYILTTGGDCGASFSSIAYLNQKYQGRLGVLWIDAHADLHTPSTSPSGNYHGMVLRHLTGNQEFSDQPVLPLRPYQIAYLGLRDTEYQEDDFIKENGVLRFGADDVMASDDCLKTIIDYFKKNGITHLHLHVDCDVMDEIFFPHVHVPEPKGLSLLRLLEVLQYLRESMPVAGACLTEYAPQTSDAGLDIIKQIYSDGLGIKLS